jgi:ankyrin repeat protein
MRIHPTAIVIASLLIAPLGSSGNQKHTDPKTLNSQMLEAAQNGDTAAVQKFLKEGADTHAKDMNGETALTIAASSGDGPLLSLLLGKGYSTQEKNDALFSALSNHPAIVLMAAPGAAPPNPNPDQREIAGDHVVNLLLSSGAEIEARDEEGDTPLIRGAERGATKAVKLLLDKGAKIEDSDNAGATALIAASCTCADIDMPDTIDIARLLLERGARIEARDKSGTTALIHAAEWGRTGIVKLLLEKGADKEAKNNDGNTALMASAEGGGYPSAETVKFLLDHGSKIGTKNKEGQTALMLASSNSGVDQVEIVTLLIERGADFRTRDKHGDTALTLAEITYKNHKFAMPEDTAKVIRLLKQKMAAPR